MRSPLFPFIFSIILAAIISLPVQAVPTEDGLYATFNTTRGSFVAKLDFDKVPVTVANFVGLAEGSRSWVDFKTGAVRQAPFYNGITFHRVVPGFVIQGGSPNGLGTDGPGYTFGDEFHPALSHSSEAILSMANSGANTNGSQFFVTLAATPNLDEKHSVFGKIVEGMDVVHAIGLISTPVAPPETITVINSIDITRIGTAASSFNPADVSALPKVLDAQPKLYHLDNNFGLDFFRNSFSQYRPFHTTNLQTWSSLSTVQYLSAPVQSLYNVNSTTLSQSKGFYRVAGIEYPFHPTSFVGKTINLTFSSSPTSNVIIITAPPRGIIDENNPLGTFVFNGTYENVVSAYIFNSTLNNMEFIIALEGLTPEITRFSLKFHDPTKGFFTGQTYTASVGSYWPFYGSFTITP